MPDHPAHVIVLTLGDADQEIGALTVRVGDREAHRCCGPDQPTIGHVGNVRAEEPLGGVLQGVTAHIRGRGGREQPKEVRNEGKLDEVRLAVELPRYFRTEPVLTEDRVTAACADQIVLGECANQLASADALPEQPLGGGELI